MHRSITKQYARLGALTLAVCGLAACSSTQLDPKAVSEVNATMRAAEATGAQDLPNAALYLHRAEEHLSEAKDFADSGNKKMASYRLREAQADADLALQVAKTDEERKRAEQAWNRIEEFQREAR